MQGSKRAQQIVEYSSSIMIAALGRGMVPILVEKR